MIDHLFASPALLGAVLVTAMSGVMALWYAYEFSVMRSRGTAISRFAAERGLGFSFDASQAWSESYTRIPFFNSRKWNWTLFSLAHGPLDGHDCRLFDCRQGAGGPRLYTMAAFRAPGARRAPFHRETVDPGPDGKDTRWFVDCDGEWTAIYALHGFRVWGMPSAVGFVKPDPAALRRFFDRAFELHRTLGPADGSR
jgi:hypothetical protein